MAPPPGKVSGKEEEDNLETVVCLFLFSLFIAKFNPE